MECGINQSKPNPLLGSHFVHSKANAKITEAKLPKDIFSTYSTYSRAHLRIWAEWGLHASQGSILQNNQALIEKLEVKGDREERDLSQEDYLLKMSSSSPPQPQ